VCRGLAISATRDGSARRPCRGAALPARRPCARRALTLYGTSSGIEAIEGQPATIGLDLARALYRAANEGDARAVLSLVAADRGHEEIVKALIARGADVKAADKEGHTAMWLATRRGRTNIEKILTEAGASGSGLQAPGS